MNGAGDADANAHLAHVPQTLGEPRREAHHVILQEETAMVRVHSSEEEKTKGGTKASTVAK